MPYLKVGSEKNNDVLLSYADYGDGKPIVLIHGWPLTHVMWEKQIPALVEAGYRVVAYDRRGFGDSYKPWGGYDYDSFASDLNELMEHLDLQDATLVGFSMGGGEVARYIGAYGTDRVAKAVLMSAVTPYLLEGAGQSLFDGMVNGLKADRPGFLSEFTKNFVNWDTDGKDLLSEAAVDAAWTTAVLASPRATVQCVTAFSSTDFRDDLKKFDVPTLILHGDADNIVPFAISGKLAHEQIADSKLTIIEGGSHGIVMTHPEQVNQALLDFVA